MNVGSKTIAVLAILYLTRYLAILPQLTLREGQHHHFSATDSNREGSARDRSRRECVRPNRQGVACFVRASRELDPSCIVRMGYGEPSNLNRCRTRHGPSRDSQRQSDTRPTPARRAQPSVRIDKNRPLEDVVIEYSIPSDISAGIVNREARDVRDDRVIGGS